MQFTDSHCHLDFPDFSEHLEQLLKQCRHNNIKRIIVPAVTPQNWQRVLSLPAKSHQADVNIHACLGIHPWFLIMPQPSPSQAVDLAFQQKQLAQAVAHNRDSIIALGECGIDVFKAKKNTVDAQALAANIQLQEDFFAMQLSIAQQNQLPVIVHHCQSHPLILAQLKKQHFTKSGVIHAFSGSYQQAKAYVDLGFKLGIGGTITYPRAKKTINAIKRLPLSCLLLETDAPAMPPLGQQGMSNCPTNLNKVFEALTQIRSEPTEVIAQQIENNIEQLFFSPV